VEAKPVNSAAEFMAAVKQIEADATARFGGCPIRLTTAKEVLFWLGQQGVKAAGAELQETTIRLKLPIELENWSPYVRDQRTGLVLDWSLDSDPEPMADAAREPAQPNERTCVTCTHWSFYSGSPCYSAATPGDDWGSSCAKSHWKASGYDETEETYRLKLLTAQQCADYERVKL
jgi:hypothetical protein